MPRHNGASRNGGRRQAPRRDRQRKHGDLRMPAPDTRYRPRTHEAPSRRMLTPGAVVFGHVPFIEDPTAYKSRPVVVVELRADDRVVVRPITGSPNPGLGAVAIADWAAAGLKKPSSVQAREIVLDRRCDLTGFIGELTPVDRDAMLAQRIA